jgi:tellurite resistance protein
VVDEDAEDGFDPALAGERAKLRQRMDTAAIEMRRRRIGDSVGALDLSLADRISALGFDGDSAAAFDLMPLIHVAWADGRIQRKERGLILEVLSVRGFEPGSQAFLTVESLLERQPSEAFFEESLRVLKETLGDRPSVGATIVALCTQVAEAAGGMLGMRKVSPEERKLIAAIADALGERAQEEFRRKLG